MYNDLINTIKQLAGNEYLYFEDAIRIKHSPHSVPLTFWGVCVSPSGKLYAMDADQWWHEVEQHETELIATLLQRINLINKLKTA